MTSIEEKKLNRFRMLKAIYDEVNNDEYTWVNMWEIGRQLNFDRATTEQVTQFLVGEGLIAFRAIGGTIGITHTGIVEIERAESVPDQPTTYFPPVNIINVGQMVNSQIQQSSPRATQTQTITSDESSKLQATLLEIQNSIDKLNITEDTKQELISNIHTIEAQLKSPKPKRSIIKETVASIRSILEGVTGNIAATLLQKLLGF